MLHKKSVSFLSQSDNTIIREVQGPDLHLHETPLLNILL